MTKINLISRVQKLFRNDCIVIDRFGQISWSDSRPILSLVLLIPKRGMIEHRNVIFLSILFKIHLFFAICILETRQFNLKLFVLFGQWFYRLTQIYILFIHLVHPHFELFHLFIPAIQFLEQFQRLVSENRQFFLEVLDSLYITVRIASLSKWFFPQILHILLDQIHMIFVSHQNLSLILLHTLLYFHLQWIYILI